VPNWPTGDLIDSVELGDLQPENVAPTVSEVHYAASYNLLDGQTPVILVPGTYHRLHFLKGVKLWLRLSKQFTGRLSSSLVTNI